MKKQNSSIKAQIIRSAFILLAFTALAAIPFALAQRKNAVKQSSHIPSAQQDIPTFVGVALPAPKHAIGPIGTIRPVEGDYFVDAAALGIHPAAAPLPLRALASGNAASPEGAAMGTGKAFFGVTHEVINGTTTSLFGTLSTGWTPGESVQLYFGGVLLTTAIAGADGQVAIGISTSGIGYITLEEIGLTSGKDTGGVVQATTTGPFLPGVTGAPHAINTTASGHFYLYGWQYPVSTVVPLYRNGVLIANVSTNASGRFFVVFTPANNGDTSANYS